MPTMTVERHNLSVSAVETVEEAMRQFDTDKGIAWAHLLHLLALCDLAVFVMTPDRVLAHDEVAPSTEAPADVLEMPWHSNAAEAVMALVAAGYLAQKPTLLHRDHAHSTYLDAGRAFEAITVTTSFKAVAVAYTNVDSPRPWSNGWARDWEVVDELDVPAGTYVIASTGDFGMTVRSIGYAAPQAAREPDPYDLITRDGHGATRAEAACGTCGGQWNAQYGSWRFRPQRPADPEWAYNDAENHDNGTIACPVDGCAGRVGFLIT